MNGIQLLLVAVNKADVCVTVPWKLAKIMISNQRLPTMHRWHYLHKPVGVSVW
jgi:hypothetical protein